MIYDFLLDNCNKQIAWRLPGIPWNVYLLSIRDLSWVLGSGVAEPYTDGLFRAISKRLRPHIFWDVGANLGYYSWLLLGQDRSVQCFLFEPDPTNADCIRKTVKGAGLETVTLFQLAASDIDGKADFAVDTLSGATGTLEVRTRNFGEIQWGKVAPIIQVDQAKLDSIAAREQLPVPDLIKIDVEGAEHRVLDGLKQTIQRSQPMLIIECVDSKTRDILAWLQSLGYELMDACNAGPYRPSSQMVLAIPQRYESERIALVEEWKENFSC
ncbi:MAG: FkbM family methyltransferase [Candidatus Obscuribacterales bacterium]|nr:FkbM family methyltransferase [Candidatus Obscuribacterales bacterium]